MEKNPFVTAVIVAAGGSTRMGGGISKQLLLLNGEPVIAHTLRAFGQAGPIRELVVVCREQEQATLTALVERLGIEKKTVFPLGGGTRQESVFRGIRAASPQATYFAIHDGARALITPEGIARVVEDAFIHRASTAAVPVKDTIKTADAQGFVTGTPERAALWSVQTPQVFEKALYLRAMEQALRERMDYTDDCQLVERLGMPVHLCMGSYENIKLTTVEDIPVARQILQKRKEQAT